MRLTLPTPTSPGISGEPRPSLGERLAVDIRRSLTAKKKRLFPDFLSIQIKASHSLQKIQTGPQLVYSWR